MKLKNINALNNLIQKSLKDIVTEDYALLDLPNHRNIGDQLIYQGELDFLKTLPYKCIKKSSATFNYNQEISAHTILLQGGGNFGDLYTLHQKFREKIIAENPQKKIIIFPQSIHFENEKNAVVSAKIFNAHGNVTICARDQFSLDFLSKHYTNCKIILLPDMAFCSSYIKPKKPKEDLLIMKRRDFELGNTDDFVNNFGYPEIDWPTFENSNTERVSKIYEKINNKFSKIYFKSTRNNSVFGAFPLRNEKDYINLGIQFMSNYKFVISTRLHGHILCLLLGIPSIIVNNSYGKNKRFYDTWLKDIPNSYYANSIEEGIELYKTIKNE